MAKPILSPKCSDSYANALEDITQILDVSANPKEVAELTKNVINAIHNQTAKPSDVIVSFSLNGLLSGLGTPIANALGVPFKAIHNPLVDLVQTVIVEGKGWKGVQEIASGFKAMTDSFNLAVQMGKEGWSKAYPLDFNATLGRLAKDNQLDKGELREQLINEVIDYKAQLVASSTGNSFADARRAVIDSGYMSTDAQINNELQVYLNEAYDYMRNSFTGKLSKFRWINVPTKATVAIDEFGKSLFRMYKIGRLASEKASKQVAEKGGDYQAIRDQLMKDTLKGIETGNATESLRQLQKNTGKVFGMGEGDFMPYTSVKEYAQREMFQERLTGIPASVHRVVQEHPSIRMFVPFLKTPWNITKEGFSYLPVAPVLIKKGYPMAANALNKLMGKEHQDSIKHLGPYFEMSNQQMLARQMVGAAYFTGIMAYLDDDSITGKPRNAQEAQRWKDQGIPEQSIKIGDKWISYGRIEPIATVIGLATELKRAMEDYNNPPAGEEPNDQIVKGIMYATKANIMQKSFVDGFNQLANGLTDPEQQGATLALAATRPLTPAIMNQVARIIDPHERQATTVGEKMMQRVPLLRETLPVEYGLYGGERKGNLGQELTSINVQSAEQTPLQRAFTETGANPVRNNARLKGVGLDNDQLAEYRKLINERITPNLNALIESSMYQKLPKGQQRVVLEKAVTRLKGPVAKEYFYKLRQTDAKMAAKFLAVEMEKRGLE